MIEKTRWLDVPIERQDPLQNKIDKVKEQRNSIYQQSIELTKNFKEIYLRAGTIPKLAAQLNALKDSWYMTLQISQPAKGGTNVVALSEKKCPFVKQLHKAYSKKYKEFYFANRDKIDNKDPAVLKEYEELKADETRFKLFREEFTKQFTQNHQTLRTQYLKESPNMQEFMQLVAKTANDPKFFVIELKALEKASDTKTLVTGVGLLLGYLHYRISLLNEIMKILDSEMQALEKAKTTNAGTEQIQKYEQEIERYIEQYEKKHEITPEQKKFFSSIQLKIKSTFKYWDDMKKYFAGINESQDETMKSQGLEMYYEYLTNLILKNQQIDNTIKGGNATLFLTLNDYLPILNALTNQSTVLYEHIENHWKQWNTYLKAAHAQAKRSVKTYDIQNMQTVVHSLELRYRQAYARTAEGHDFYRIVNNANKKFWEEGLMKAGSVSLERTKQYGHALGSFILMDSNSKAINYVAEMLGTLEGFYHFLDILYSNERYYNVSAYKLHTGHAEALLDAITLLALGTQEFMSGINKLKQVAQKMQAYYQKNKLDTTDVDGLLARINTFETGIATDDTNKIKLKNPYQYLATTKRETKVDNHLYNRQRNFKHVTNSDYLAEIRWPYYYKTIEERKKDLFNPNIILFCVQTKWPNKEFLAQLRQQKPDMEALIKKSKAAAASGYYIVPE